MIAGARLRRAALRAAAGALLVLPFLLLGAATPWLAARPTLAALEAATLDWRYRMRGPLPVIAPVAILAIDDASVRALGGWPLPRARLAAAVRRLHAAGASAVALDLVLADPAPDPADDRALVRAMQSGGRTVLGVALQGTDAASPPPPASAIEALERAAVPVLRGPAAPAPPQLHEALVPPAELQRAAAGLGHVNVALGRDGGLRHLYPVLAFDGLGVPALAVAAVRVHLGLPRTAVDLRLPGALHLGDRRVPVGSRGRWSLNLHGPRGSVPTHALADLLAGQLPADALAGRIVWIGATATAVGDSFATPYDPALPGVEALATASANLLENRFLVRDSWTQAAAMLAVLLVGAATLGAARLAPAGLAVLLTPVPVLAWAGLTLGGFLAWNLWLNLTLPALSGALAAAVVGAWRLLLTDHQRRRLMSYLPDPLAGALAASDTPRLAGARAGVAVLFVDLAGFTSQSERVGPAGTADLLRRLHGLVDDVAAAHGGYVDSFTGDGAMLVFGVPEPGARDAANALACARALLARGDAAGFELRAGLHFGPVELAQLGGPHRRQVTVAGDTVNLASRLMDAAKPFNARLVASDALARAAERADGPETLTGLTRHRSQTVRGRSAAVDLWTG